MPICAIHQSFSRRSILAYRPAFTGVNKEISFSVKSPGGFVQAQTAERDRNAPLATGIAHFLNCLLLRNRSDCLYSFPFDLLGLRRQIEFSQWEEGLEFPQPAEAESQAPSIGQHIPRNLLSRSGFHSIVRTIGDLACGFLG